MDIALDESKLKVQIEFSVRVQCGWYRGFYFDNFRPGILKYPGAFLFSPGCSMLKYHKGIPDAIRNMAYQGKERKNGTGKRSKEIRNFGTCRSA